MAKKPIAVVRAERIMKAARKLVRIETAFAAGENVRTAKAKAKRELDDAVEDYRSHRPVRTRRL